MILVLLLAAYAFVTQNIRITSRFSITGARARFFGLVILIVAFPAMFLVQPLVMTFAPSIAHDPVAFRATGLAFILAIVVVIAFLFKDPAPAA